MLSDGEKSALIAEANRRLFLDSAPGYEDTAEGDLIYRLVDALKASLTVPDGDVRERLERNIEPLNPSASDFEIHHTVNNLLAAFPILSRDTAGEIEAEACDVPVLGSYKRGYQDGLARAAEIVRNGR